MTNCTIFNGPLEGIRKKWWSNIGISRTRLKPLTVHLCILIEGPELVFKFMEISADAGCMSINPFIENDQMLHPPPEISWEKEMILHWTKPVRGGIKKKNWFFFQKNSEGGGGGSRRIQNFLIRKKLRFFWIFFYKGGGSHLFQKGVIIKTGDFWMISPKGRGCLSQSIRILS